jgi:hypothetical protein
MGMGGILLPVGKIKVKKARGRRLDAEDLREQTENVLRILNERLDSFDKALAKLEKSLRDAD